MSLAGTQCSSSAAGEAAAPVGAGLTRGLWDQPCTVHDHWPGVGRGGHSCDSGRASKAARGHLRFAFLPVIAWKGGDPKGLLFLAWQEFCSSDA